jgi:predicted O-methyltransferase YrrM
MDQETWDAVDAYISATFVHEDEALRQASLDSDAAGLPSIAVTPAHGKMLHLFCRMVGARRVLEIGTLGGYSAIWMARALPSDGTLTSLEISGKHAAVARANIDRAGVGGRVEIVVAPAIETLARLEGPFDLVFIDADKQSTADYFSHAVRLSHVGTVIVVDNVVRKGGVVDAKSEDEMVRGIRRFNDSLPSYANVTATTVQTVGAKGYDGFTLAVVL